MNHRRLSFLVVVALVFLTHISPYAVAFSTVTPSTRLGRTSFVGRSRDTSFLLRRGVNQSPVATRRSCRSPTSLSVATNSIAQPLTVLQNCFLKVLPVCTAAMLSFFSRTRKHDSRTKARDSLSLCTVGFLLGRSSTKPFWKRYESVRDIPSNCFGPTAPILTGRAVLVSDGVPYHSLFAHAILVVSDRTSERTKSCRKRLCRFASVPLIPPKRPSLANPGR